MGIHGLSSFFLSSNDNMRNFYLHNTYLIINFSNLASTIFRNFHVNYLYGGNYHDYQVRVNSFIDLLIKCEIIPVFIFYGAKDEANMKHNIDMRRMQYNLNTCIEINNENLISILPRLIRDCLSSIVQERKFQYELENVEEDKEVVMLADKYQCPIVSYDSDFFIFPLEFGYIPMTSLELENSKETECDCCPSGFHYSLPCRIFHRANVSLQNGDIFNSDLFPIYALICGNDSVETSEFDQLYKFLNIEDSQRFQKLDALMVWLNQFETEQEAIDKILEICCENDNLLELIRISHKQFELKIDDFASEPFDFLPEYIQKRLKRGLINSSMLDGFIRGNITLMVTVENVDFPSVNYISKKHRYQIYSFFSKYFPNRTSFDEHFREYTSIKTIKVNCSTLQKFDTTHYFIDSEQSFIKLFITEFLTNKDQGQVDKPVLVYLVISILFEYCHTKNLFYEHVKETSFYKLLINFYNFPIIKKPDYLHIDIIHVFNELQTMQSMIKNLLMLDESDDYAEFIVPAYNLFCGIFAYNITRYFQKQEDSMPCNYVVNNCRGLFVHVLDIFDELMECIQTYH